MQHEFSRIFETKIREKWCRERWCPVMDNKRILTRPRRESRTNFLPFARPSITQAEIDEVVDTLRSGWLTTGPKTKRFECEFAERVGVRHARSGNSATAALHLSL